MSFVRVQGSKQTGCSASGKIKKRSKKTPAWDDTNQDLSVHKLTKHELERRHVIHQSSNISSVKLEKQQKALAKALRKTPQSEESVRTAVLREMLYDGDELQDVLSHTDRVMSVVKDLFGDDPKRYTGLPNVTFAPGQQNQIDRSMLSISQSTEIPNKNEKPDPPILNEMTEDSESDDDEDTPSSLQMEPEKETSNPGQLNETPKGLAINDTIKVRKTKKRTVTPDEETNVSSLSDVDGLKRVICGLEQEVEEYEKMAGHQSAPKPNKDTGGLGGYTASLLDTITRLVQYLKKSEKLLQSETKKTTEMQKDLLEHRELTDALTSELMVTQEQLLGLQTEFQKYRSNTDSQLNYLKHTIYSMCNGNPEMQSQPQFQPYPQYIQQQPMLQKQGFQPYQPQPKINPPQNDIPTQPEITTLPHPEFIDDNTSDFKLTDETQAPNKNDSATELADQFTAALSTLPAYVKPLQTAVLLSPPRQRDRSTLPKPTGLTANQLSAVPGEVPVSSTDEATAVSVTLSSNMPPPHSDLTEQIATLTQQRSQAQARLQSLQAYRKPLADAGNVTTTNSDVMTKPNKTVTSVIRDGSVSPAISPIPHEFAVPGKTIAVTLPRVEELELSAASTPSPKSQQGKENRSNELPIRTVSNFASNTAPSSNFQASTDGGFFALSSHMSQ